MKNSGRDLRALSGKVGTGFPSKCDADVSAAYAAGRRYARRADLAPLALRLPRRGGVAGAARAGDCASADAGSLASCSITRKRATFFWCWS